MSVKHAILHYQGQDITLPILKGTIGDEAIDIKPLSKATHLLSFDPGFVLTASCESKITYIDGEQGVLLYRGYSIEELAQRSHFIETAYLLIYGELPSVSELSSFQEAINEHTMVHEQMVDFYRGFRRDAHPMAIMVSVVGALSAFYHDSLDITNPQHRELATYRVIAKMPTIAAMAYKYAQGHPFTYPRNALDYPANFLHMLFALPTEPYDINPILAKALNLILILHADHEQNASTATVRLAGSSKANPFACIAAGIATLWGPAHGGANEAALNMLKAIGDVSHIPQYLKKAKDKDDPFRLNGFGHRIYKHYDPRAKIMQQTCYEVLEELGLGEQPLFKLALELERIALQDEYFIEKRLYPNIDFYSGIVLQALGIPTTLFTVVFAVARSVGWLAHWNEMIADPHHKICRPRQIYTGPSQRAFMPIDQRS